MADEFKPGDIVRLKSGGPDMTVAVIGPNQYGQIKAFCDWFSGTKRISEEFEITSLIPSDSGDKTLTVKFVKSNEN